VVVEGFAAHEVQGSIYSVRSSFFFTITVYSVKFFIIMQKNVDANVRTYDRCCGYASDGAQPLRCWFSCVVV
jgi:hypothetical protein